MFYSQPDTDMMRHLGYLISFFTNEKGMLSNLTHNPGLGNSDHTCLAFQLNCYQKITIGKKIPNYFKTDYNTIRERLVKIEWTSELEGSFDIAYPKFIELLELSIGGCIPMHNVLNKKCNLYMKTDALRKKNRKHKLWKRYCRTRTI